MNEVLLIFSGAIISYLLPFAVKAITYTFKRKSPTIVCGNWYGYIWWTKNGEILFDEMNVNIKKGIVSEYYATFLDSYGTYSGKAFIECNNLCINLSLKDAVYGGTSFHRYDLSTFENCNNLYGFWLSINADKKVSCGGAMLSRKKIDTVKSLEIAKKQYCINTDTPVLSLFF